MYKVITVKNLTRVGTVCTIDEIIFEKESEQAMSRYKVGDKVVIRDDLVEYVEYGEVPVISKMLDHKGKTLEVESIGSDYYSMNNFCYWCDDVMKDDKKKKKEEGS